jgi:hypothetical protein
MQIKSIGIDLGKTTFHLIALGDCSQVRNRQEILPLTTTGLQSQSALLADRVRKTQSNDVPENLWRNEFLHDRGD